MKTALAYLAAAIVLFIALGFAVGWFSFTNEGDHSNIRIESREIEEAGDKTTRAAVDALEGVGDAVRYGGRKLEKAGDDLQHETTGNRADDGR
jgi:hypothetical protein